MAFSGPLAAASRPIRTSHAVLRHAVRGGAIAQPAAGGPLVVGDAAPLFRSRMLGGGVNIVGRRQQYDVAPDGRFLINVETEAPLTEPITVIQNWAARN